MEDRENPHRRLMRESLVIKYSSLTVLTAILFAIGLQIESRRHEGAVVGEVLQSSFAKFRHKVHDQDQKLNRPLRDMYLDV